MREKMYKLEFYVPEPDAEKVKEAVFEAGAGKIGNYACCCWQVPGTGQFRPCEGSNPHIGEKGLLEKVVEVKVELVCKASKLKKAIKALKMAHPYETPAYQYWKINLHIS
jgi:hypothetical protein